jgi:hypothetical protein
MEHSVGVVRFVHGRVEGHTKAASSVLSNSMECLFRTVSSCVHGQFSLGAEPLWLNSMDKQQDPARRSPNWATKGYWKSY